LPSGKNWKFLFDIINYWCFILIKYTIQFYEIITAAKSVQTLGNEILNLASTLPNCHFFLDEGIFYIHVSREKLLKQCWYGKFVHKMRMKLTTELIRQLSNIINVESFLWISCQNGQQPLEEKLPGK